jgi:hypothetical protein
MPRPSAEQLGLQARRGVRAHPRGRLALVPQYVRLLLLCARSGTDSFEGEGADALYCACRASFLWKGYNLEYKLGSVRFLLTVSYLLVLCHVLVVVVALALATGFQMPVFFGSFSLQLRVDD